MYEKNNLKLLKKINIIRIYPNNNIFFYFKLNYIKHLCRIINFK